jgi:hypothetical protein
MVSRDLQYETFILSDEEFDHYSEKFILRLNIFYDMLERGEIPSK